mmetsp:Transcript_138876/g.241621  ORF Transcript_138876/g.241621 Transcript_138876/m.241621 type:complete len:221 (-) Transcript_138876:880-1542(-)
MLRCPLSRDASNGCLPGILLKVRSQQNLNAWPLSMGTMFKNGSNSPRSRMYCSLCASKLLMSQSKTWCLCSHSVWPLFSFEGSNGPLNAPSVRFRSSNSNSSLDFSVSVPSSNRIFQLPEASLFSTSVHGGPLSLSSVITKPFIPLSRPTPNIRCKEPPFFSSFNPDSASSPVMKKIKGASKPNPRCNLAQATSTSIKKSWPAGLKSQSMPFGSSNASFA